MEVFLLTRQNIFVSLKDAANILKSGVREDSENQ